KDDFGRHDRPPRRLLALGVEAIYNTLSTTRPKGHGPPQTAGTRRAGNPPRHGRLPMSRDDGRQATTASLSALKIGTRLAEDYEAERILGAGGMGQVYL